MWRDRKPGLSSLEAIFIFMFHITIQTPYLIIKFIHDDFPYPYHTFGGLSIGLIILCLFLWWQVRRRKKSEM